MLIKYDKLFISLVFSVLVIIIAVGCNSNKASKGYFTDH